MTTETGTQQIEQDAHPERSYFSIIPNIVDDLDLSPYAYRLYGHLKRVAGEGGKCYQSARHMAERCHMSVGMIAQAKIELREEGLITIERTFNTLGRGRDNIRIVPIWARNETHCSPDDHGDHTVIIGDHLVIPKEEPVVKKNPVGAEKKTVAKDATEGAKGAPITPVEVAIFRNVVGRYPNRTLFDKVRNIINAKEPDQPFMRRCYEEWVSRGYNSNSIKWLEDWYGRGEIPLCKAANMNGSSSKPKARFL